MKSTKNLGSTAVLIAALFTLSFASAYTMAQAQSVPPKKEFKTLLKTAKGAFRAPEDCRVLRQEAARLTASSAEHAKLADTYAKTVPNPMESKHGDTFGHGASHCKKWAELQAEEAEALAMLHENMAKDADQK